MGLSWLWILSGGLDFLEFLKTVLSRHFQLKEEICSLKLDPEQTIGLLDKCFWEKNIPRVYIGNTGRLLCSWQAEPHLWDLGLPTPMSLQCVPRCTNNFLLLAAGRCALGPGGRWGVRPLEQPLCMGGMGARSSGTVLGVFRGSQADGAPLSPVVTCFLLPLLTCLPFLPHFFSQSFLRSHSNQLFAT